MVSICDAVFFLREKWSLASSRLRQGVLLNRNSDWELSMRAKAIYVYIRHKFYTVPDSARDVGINLPTAMVVTDWVNCGPARGISQ